MDKQKERKKLTELIVDAIRSYRDTLCFGSRANGKTLDISSHIADHLLADGWIRPPCKVGQTVWFIRNKTEIIATCVEKIILKHGGLYIKLSHNSLYETTCRSIGKTVFLSREDAEKALETLNQPCTNLAPTDTPTDTPTEKALKGVE